MGKTVYVLVGFVLFVLFCIVLHCLLTKKERKRINDNLMSDILSTINRRGTVVTVKQQYYDDDNDDDDDDSDNTDEDSQKPSFV